MKYGAVGNLITNRLDFVDGTQVDGIMGGTAYGLEGLRLVEDDCGLIANVGTDWEKWYGKWFDDNNMTREGVQITSDFTAYNFVRYNPDGTYFEDTLVGTSTYAWNNFGYMTPTARDIGRVAAGLKGLNVSRGLDIVFWRELGALKEKHGFKIMWEISTASTEPENIDRLMETLQFVDYFSINLPESKRMFSQDSEEGCISFIKKLPVEYTLFRTGDKGTYSVTPDGHWFIPCRRWNGEIVDPTGCGNSSTAGALWAAAEGYDPIMVGIIANLVAHYNVRQYGPVLQMTKELREELMDAAREERESYPSI